MSTSERRLKVLREALVEVRAENPDRPSHEDVVRVTRRLHPYLYDGSFTANLAKLDLFTPEQAEGSTASKREERELEIEQVLIYFLNAGEARA